MARKRRVGGRAFRDVDEHPKAVAHIVVEGPFQPEDDRSGDGVLIEVGRFAAHQEQ